MYYYISIHSDDYTKKVKSKILEQYLVHILEFEKESHLTFSKEINGERIKIRGIPADNDGNYGFDTLEGIEEVNLIEIDLPKYIDDILEQTIAEIATAIAKEFSWIIDEDHGLS
ncbi:hypothetical protein M3194_02600 [Paenibacillus glycanilyticus]|uniref:hypothetical protein n=1 Tax=Paenibacillus glycanilyticus TaxID=126569 RepID=UPI00203D5EB4|nr:hypothetical protein [Paenibacillus glycanilyticus]MCM3626257.1 hypothetical protein [Paenibacillus glycanilyticus]